MKAAGLPLDASAVSYTHANNTLIISVRTVAQAMGICFFVISLICLFSFDQYAKPASILEKEVRERLERAQIKDDSPASSSSASSSSSSALAPSSSSGRPTANVATKPRDGDVDCKQQ